MDISRNQKSSSSKTVCRFFFLENYELKKKRKHVVVTIVVIVTASRKVKIEKKRKKKKKRKQVGHSRIQNDDFFLRQGKLKWRKSSYCFVFVSFSPLGQACRPTQKNFLKKKKLLHWMSFYFLFSFFFFLFLFLFSFLFFRGKISVRVPCWQWEKERGFGKRAAESLGLVWFVFGERYFSRTT